MNKEDFDNDEPIHHFEGKNLLYSCPSEPPSAQSGNSSSPNTQSPHATISPPVKQSLHKLLGLLKWLTIFRPSKHTSPSIVNLNYYFIENRTIENNNLSYNNAMKIISQVLNNYGTIQENNFYGKNEQQSNENEGKEDVEDVDHTEVVEVKQTPVKEPVVKQSDMNKDYSNSKLVPLLTYPDQANYLIGWMHLNIERQPKISEKIRIIKALDSRYYFKSKVGYNDYIGEFGGDFSASWYSRLMKREIPSDELDVILESLDTSIFPIKK